jgi:hypothetical protein
LRAIFKVATCPLSDDSEDAQSPRVVVVVWSQQIEAIWFKADEIALVRLLVWAIFVGCVRGWLATRAVCALGAQSQRVTDGVAHVHMQLLKLSAPSNDGNKHFCSSRRRAVLEVDPFLDKQASSASSKGPRDFAPESHEKKDARVDDSQRDERDHYGRELKEKYQGL